MLSSSATALCRRDADGQLTPKVATSPSVGPAAAAECAAAAISAPPMEATTPLECSTSSGRQASQKQLSASAVPWYPRMIGRSESACSQPFREDEFPCEPRLPVGGVAVSPEAHQPSPQDARTPMHTASRSVSGWRYVSGAASYTPAGTDDDDDVVIVRFRDDEAQDEAAMIRRLAEGAFWSTDAPAAEGLHHVRGVWDAVPADTGDLRDDEDCDWEDDSAAYEDSLDSEQLDWLEEQLQARDNPQNFFF